MNFLPKVFWSWFDPKCGYKTVNKSFKMLVDSGGLREREPSGIAFRTRLKTADAFWFPEKQAVSYFLKISFLFVRM